MPKTNNQKRKILHLRDILLRETDEDHFLTVNEIIEKLSTGWDIKVERKTLYDDLETLKEYGLEIDVSDNRRGHYVYKRDFELSELKMLADAVVSSQFISAAASRKILKTLFSLCSKYQEQALRSHLVVSQTEKEGAENIIYNTETLNHAINENKQITFKYADFGVDKKTHIRDGLRTASPYYLHINDNKYYLIAYYEKYNKIVNFRVDRMRNVNIINEESRPIETGFDIKSYLTGMFSMYGGDSITVKLKGKASLSNNIIDKFGTDTFIYPDTGDCFIASVKVQISPSFFGWVLQFGNMIEIISPPQVRKDYFEKLHEAIELYSGEP